MTHHTSVDRPVRRGHDRGEHSPRVSAAQMALMAEDLRRLTLALHDLSRHERHWHAARRAVGRSGAVPRSGSTRAPVQGLVA
ncbi:hypothetical protein ACFVGM_11400 [Kitasatospora purpeofusca]|uniref:hypothetical protein n=1 Tax=Kitasatospora purpeofusca TaxID=67352 RepID=UPI0036C58424